MGHSRHPRLEYVVMCVGGDGGMGQEGEWEGEGTKKMSVTSDNQFNDLTQSNGGWGGSAVGPGKGTKIPFFRLSVPLSAGYTGAWVRLIR